MFYIPEKVGAWCGGRNLLQTFRAIGKSCCEK